MGLIERPWARVKKPTVIPGAVDRDLVAVMPDRELAELLRDHLVPSGSAGAARHTWDLFWELLRDDDELADRAFDILEEFLDQTEDALEEALDADDDSQLKRMQKFQLNTENAWQRLQKTPTAAPRTARSERRLIAAIARHRTAVLADGGPTNADLKLWEVLPSGKTTSSERRRR